MESLVWDLGVVFKWFKIQLKVLKYLHYALWEKLSSWRSYLLLGHNFLVLALWYIWVWNIGPSSTRLEESPPVIIKTLNVLDNVYIKGLILTRGWVSFLYWLQVYTRICKQSYFFFFFFDNNNQSYFFYHKGLYMKML